MKLILHYKDKTYFVFKQVLSAKKFKKFLIKRTERIYTNIFDLKELIKAF